MLNNKLFLKKQDLHNSTNVGQKSKRICTLNIKYNLNTEWKNPDKDTQFVVTMGGISQQDRTKILLPSTFITTPNTCTSNTAQCSTVSDKNARTQHPIKSNDRKTALFLKEVLNQKSKQTSKGKPTNNKSQNFKSYINN